ncbi:MAG TPA: hypothetical protein VFR18_26645 [Terriglobia bacterium]|nr:hypothetical protein [Terriglobia bacterium]
MPSLGLFGEEVEKGERTMQVRYRLFKSVMKSWEDLCADAAAFASTIGRERLINISVSQADTGGQGVIFVWYWE